MVDMMFGGVGVATAFFLAFVIARLAGVEAQKVRTVAFFVALEAERAECLATAGLGLLIKSKDGTWANQEPPLNNDRIRLRASSDRPCPGNPAFGWATREWLVELLDDFEPGEELVAYLAWDAPMNSSGGDPGYAVRLREVGQPPAPSQEVREGRNKPLPLTPEQSWAVRLSLPRIRESMASPRTPKAEGLVINAAWKPLAGRLREFSRPRLERRIGPSIIDATGNATAPATETTGIANTIKYRPTTPRLCGIYVGPTKEDNGKIEAAHGCLAIEMRASIMEQNVMAAGNFLSFFTDKLDKWKARPAIEEVCSYVRRNTVGSLPPPWPLWHFLPSVDVGDGDLLAKPALLIRAKDGPCLFDPSELLLTRLTDDLALAIEPSVTEGLLSTNRQTARDRMAEITPLNAATPGVAWVAGMRGTGLVTSEGLIRSGTRKGTEQLHLSCEPPDWLIAKPRYPLLTDDWDPGRLPATNVVRTLAALLLFCEDSTLADCGLRQDPRLWWQPITAADPSKAQ